MKLSSQAQAFILHFGEMGSRWGFNRTVGQMFALLTIQSEPMNADQLAQALKISRGNVSMGLKELQSWRLVELRHLPGDRKDYFTAAGSIWDLARTVFEERRKRELDPTLSLLRELLLNAPEDKQEAEEQKKIQEVYNLLELLDRFANTLSRLEQKDLIKLMKLGSGISKLLELKNKATGVQGGKSTAK
ncbi:GbsR/MarR family transcriptional regulator [Microbulbifer thermotolerans]|uniref:HTH-type transcriptional regulator n=1 Tax=Microbulbifer thermotolerans TaxID=252514 RepID=A0A143HJ74_MICTH|nr:MarR family transcriptional regulator [Microbulbifer thermotolerans]AMX01774.1 transcriptional regulator [Microbulbifer thermotolerans]MCX2779550.1 MarR family transcriptional regulator [Microbulbifer thermotolerans]MCX2783386.1 MarR family transcriptional regulator [Microbulbifer thermotolerans]MCX2793422.1 MarR family transcriptional regulator [Microbulbifer thermotolerans]MCX2801363.1 MarR family transcriptional regulator [Microbulbifer thermotolerans]